MPNIGGGAFSSVRLLIGTAATSSVDFVVETLSADTSIPMQIDGGTISASSSYTVASDIELEVLGSSDRNKGIHVYTTGDEPLFVIGENYINGVNHGVFLAYPCLQLELAREYTYYVFSAEDSSGFAHSQFLLVGCENETLFVIYPTQDVNIPTDLQIENAPTVLVSTGSFSWQLRLNQMQTLLVNSHENLTGTKIVSNRPITVISGHECGNIADSAGVCEPLAIHIPPLDTWGSKFLLAPFAGRASDQYFKIIAASQTSINYTCGKVSYHFHDIIQHLFNSSEYCYLESLDPVLVFQASIDNVIDSSGDTAVALISPIGSYVNRVSFYALPTTTFPSTFISVTVTAELYTEIDILLDNEVIDCDWTKINNSDMVTVGYGCSKSGFTGSDQRSPIQHSLHATNTGLFSALVYGFSGGPALGYAYLSGQILAGM